MTQFGRALKELGIELILAHSPQAKGRVERFFGLAQDRWVKEMRLAKAKQRTFLLCGDKIGFPARIPEPHQRE